MGSILNKVGSFFLDTIEVVVVALAIFVLVYLFLFQPHQVRGNSMYPNFHDKEYLLTDKITYRFHEPQRGDVIIFKAPTNPELEYIKRIVGLPGDLVKISQGQVFINGEILPEPYLPDDIFTSNGRMWQSLEEETVRENHYFVLGDNRSHSSDSRDWGQVPRGNIIGRAWLKYWPPQSFGVIKYEEQLSLANSFVNLL